MKSHYGFLYKIFKYLFGGDIISILMPSQDSKENLWLVIGRINEKQDRFDVLFSLTCLPTHIESYRSTIDHYYKAKEFRELEQPK